MSRGFSFLLWGGSWCTSGNAKGLFLTMQSGSVMVGLGPNGVPRIELELVACNVSTLPVVLALWPQEDFLFCRVYKLPLVNAIIEGLYFSTAGKLITQQGLLADGPWRKPILWIPCT